MKKKGEKIEGKSPLKIEGWDEEKGEDFSEIFGNGNTWKSRNIIRI